MIFIAMEKIDFTKQFAARLRDAMVAAGHHSDKSISGVNIQTLANITGHSPQICRKYLRGLAIPEPLKLIEISKKLKVSPGWLLFGASNNDNARSHSQLSIDKNILLYILRQSNFLYDTSPQREEVSEFLLDLIDDISKIDTNEEQLKKIVDLALSSATHFRIT